MIVAANAAGKIIDVEPLTYVRLTDNGWEECGPEDAQAISHHNQLYAIATPIPLPPLTDDDGSVIDDDQTVPMATIYEVPDGSIIVEAHGLATAHTGQITDLETGLVDQTISTEMRLDDIEAAITEIIIGGIE